MTPLSPSAAAYAVAFLVLCATQVYSTVLPAKKRSLADPPGFSIHAHGTGVNYAGLSAVGATSAIKVEDYVDAFVSRLHDA